MSRAGSGDHGQNAAKAAAGLPQPGIVRWTPWRKRSVVLAIRLHVISALDACERYMLSHEELMGWIDAFECAGLAGLHIKCGRRVRHRQAHIAARGINLAAD
jgi:hypothetical protein